jgi:hypothetical protein
MEVQSYYYFKDFGKFRIGGYGVVTWIIMFGFWIWWGVAKRVFGL